MIEGESHQKETVEYVVGFLFSMDLSKVVLLCKQRPAWQRGLWNGVGGHVEPGETPLEAMSREFDEEVELIGAASDQKPKLKGGGPSQWEWVKFATLMGTGFKLHLFRARELFEDAKPRTDENVRVVPLSELLTMSSASGLPYQFDLPTLPNLRSHILMALSMWWGERAKSFMIEERSSYE